MNKHFINFYILRINLLNIEYFVNYFCNNKLRKKVPGIDTEVKRKYTPISHVN